MLKRLVLRNWRSVREATIEFTPITVFIGANSSGKSNILDALHFVRYVIEHGLLEAVFAWRGFDKVHTVGVPLEENAEIEFSFVPDAQTGIEITYKLAFNVALDNSWFWYWEQIIVGDNSVAWQTASDGRTSTNEYGEESNLGLAGYFLSSKDRSDNPAVQQVIRFVTQRWQLLEEDFRPAMSMAAGDPGNLFVVDPTGKNVPVIADYIRSASPKTYKQIISDLSSLLTHVQDSTTIRDDRETRIDIIEQFDRTAPSISWGTSRLFTIVLANYICNLRLPKFPALIAIEEPDTSLNPLLLERFVDLLREYVDREEPRQFILTTHNPQLLNYLKPEEVRVVERDPETGETSVNNVPDDIKEIWLKRHTLGDAWTSRIIGGIPQL